MIYIEATLSLDDMEILEDLRVYCLGGKGVKYYDMCVFHEDDSDLAQTIRLDELSFFNSIKRGKEFGNHN